MFVELNARELIGKKIAPTPPNIHWSVPRPLLPEVPAAR
jgi:hypothetical protein